VRIILKTWSTHRSDASLWNDYTMHADLLAKVNVMLLLLLLLFTYLPFYQGKYYGRMVEQFYTPAMGVKLASYVSALMRAQ
jgi:hypothetical protein